MSEPYNTEADELREIKASKIVNRYVKWSMGSGLIPVPVLDVGVLALVQLRMLKVLSGHYDVPFMRNAGKNLIAALLGYTTTHSLRGSIFTGLLKALPGGLILGVLSMPIYSGAATYAIGKVFVQHFESGGTFLTLKPFKVKEHFAEYFEEGQAVAAELKKKPAK